MRVDLESNVQRPWWMKLVFRRLKKHLGVVPGPLLVASHRPKWLVKEILDYQLRCMGSSEYWTPTQAEILGAYVSKLNTCHF